MTGVEKRRTKGIQECINNLENLFKYYKNDSEFNYQLEVSDSAFNFIKKYLKALKIIKEKDVIVFKLKQCATYDEYNNFVIILFGFSLSEGKLLTEEEFELLKEVLGND